MIRAVAIAAGIVVVLSGCAVAEGSSVSASNGTCKPISIDALVTNPERYEGQHVCVSGYLGRMVAYGEDSADLFRTREEAQAKQAEYYLQVGLPLTVQLQPTLAKHSTEPASVKGVFHFDRRCFAQTTLGKPDTCFPSRPMKISQAQIVLGDGTRLP